MLLPMRWWAGIVASAMLLVPPMGEAAAPPVPEIVAHRGESADAPENTLAAFQLAWQRQVPTIELDVHLTKDGALVVCHDADTKRTTGVERRVANSTLAELQQLDAGRWKAPRWTGEKMPSLEEALATIPELGRCLIEIKVGPEAVPALVRAVKASGKSSSQLAVISFQADTVAEAKRQLPDIPAYFLARFRRNKETGAWSPSIKELIDTARSIGADGLDLSSSGPLDAAAIEQIKAAGLRVYIWTVDDLDAARRFAEAGVDGITTNRAAWMKEQLARE